MTGTVHPVRSDYRGNSEFGVGRPADYRSAGMNHLFLGAIFAFAALYSLASLWLPFGWDHGIMAAVGSEMARGGLPYRDGWDLKGPLSYVPFAVATLLFGNVMWGIRVLEVVILVPLLAVFMRSLRQQTSPVIGVGGALILYLWFASNGWFFTAQPDIWASVLVGIATCIVLPRGDAERPKPLMYLLAGLMIGSAGLIKPVYLGFGLAPLISALFAPVGTAHRIRTLLRDAGLLAVGAAAPIAACALYFAWNGALQIAIEAQFKYTLGSYGVRRRPLAEGLSKFGNFLSSGACALLLPFAALGLWSQRREKLPFALLSAWLFAALVSIVVQDKYYPHHLYVLYPFLVFSGALGLSALVADDRPADKVLAALFCSFLVLLVSFEPARDVRRWSVHLLGQPLAEYYAKHQLWVYNAADEVAAAKYVRDNSTPQDGLFVWGIDATILYLSERRNPTRFTFDLPLIINGPFRKAYRAEAIAGLTSAPPKFIVVGTGWNASDKQTLLADFEELRRFLEASYTPSAKFGSVEIYRRTTPTN